MSKDTANKLHVSHITMAFIAAMNTMTSINTKVGINGETVLTEEGVGDVRVSLFAMLNRGLELSYIRNQLRKVKTDTEWEDMFVMALSVRNIRGGKGERQLFYDMFHALTDAKPVAAAALVEFIPAFGCWRDMWVLLQETKSVEVHDAILIYTTHEFHYNKTSLLAKWLPREKSKTFKNLVPLLARTLFPGREHRKQLVAYRKQVSAMNHALKTTEINMCGGAWSAIEPTHVPGRSLKLHHAAFLNRTLEREGGTQKRKATNALRFPDSEDRMQCREHFLESLKGGKKLKGAHVVFPHELVQDCMQRGLNRESEDILQAQWNSIRSSTVNLGRVVPMCDFSGSMAGIPLQASMALGILISEVASEQFRDHMLTFDSTPTWLSFQGMTRLVEKTKKAQMVGQGLSTDFYKACQLILERMVTAKIPVGEEPEDLVVLTDMGWDQANAKSGGWKSQVQRIREEFQEAGRRVWPDHPTGWQIPRIVIWNLRAEYKDFHATAQDDGVVMMSGWSPSALKSLQNKGVQVRTSMDYMRSVLDDPMYAPVREAIRPWLYQSSLV